MEPIKLQTLYLYYFDKNNKEHLTFFKKLANDPTILSRFQGIGVGLLHPFGQEIFDKGFFVGTLEQLIGYVHIGAFNQQEKSVYLRTAVDKDQRGKQYGSKLLSEVTEYIFSHYLQVEQIIGKIVPDNIASLKAAEAAGYRFLEKDYYGIKNPYLERPHCK